MNLDVSSLKKYTVILQHHTVSRLFLHLSLQRTNNDRNHILASGFIISYLTGGAMLNRHKIALKDSNRVT